MLILAALSLVVIVRLHLWEFPPRQRIESIEQRRRGAWVLVVLAGFAIWIAEGLGVSLAAAWLAIDPDASPTPREAAQLVGATYLGALVALAIILRLHAWMIPVLGPGFRWRDAATGAGAMLLLMPVIMALSAGLQWFATWLASATGGTPPDPIAHETLRMITAPETARDGWWWLTVALVTIGAPIVEEVIFRGFVQSGFRMVAPNGWAAIVITSLIFAGVHVGSVEWHALATLFALSICFGVAMERSGRVVVPIAMHAIFNGLNVVMAVSVA